MPEAAADLPSQIPAPVQFVRVDSERQAAGDTGADERRMPPVYQDFLAHCVMEQIDIDMLTPPDQPGFSDMTHDFLAKRVKNIHAEIMKTGVDMEHPAPVIPHLMVVRNLQSYYHRYPHISAVGHKNEDRVVNKRRQEELAQYILVAEGFDRSYPEIKFAQIIFEECGLDERTVAQNAITALLASYGKAITGLPQAGRR